MSEPDYTWTLDHPEDPPPPWEPSMLERAEGGGEMVLANLSHQCHPLGCDSIHASEDDFYGIARRAVHCALIHMGEREDDVSYKLPEMEPGQECSAHVERYAQWAERRERTEQALRRSRSRYAREWTVPVRNVRGRRGPAFLKGR